MALTVAKIGTTITKIGLAWSVATIAAGAATGAAVAGFTRPAPRPAAAAVHKRLAVAARPAPLGAQQGAKICDDLNTWVAGSWQQSRPRFDDQMESDASEAGYSVLGNDLLELETNLINLNSGALKTSLPNHYPVTGMGALTHDCAGYQVSIRKP